MILPLLTLSVMAAEGYFLPPLQHGAQPSSIRGQAQGNEFYPEYNKIEENLNYNNRFLYQSPHYQHFADSQRYYSQAAAQQAYGPPLQQIYQQQEPLTEQVYSDIPNSPIYIQPHDEETTRQQTLTITPQYLNLPSQSQQNALSQYPGQFQANLRGPQGVQGLQTTAQTTIPVLVKVSDNQALIVPVRAVYALPGFLERLVQRVQGYYSVYNPIENLVVDRPYYVPTGGSAVQPVDVSSAGDATAQPIKADLVEESSQGSSQSAEADSPMIDVKITDLKQEDTKEETTTAGQVEDEKESTTEPSTEESKDSTEKNGDSETEASEASDATTVPALPSSDDTPSSTEAASTSISPSSEEPSTTTKPEDKPVESSSAEDNSATSDLDSAGYTYYRPAVPFYYPSQ